MKENKELVFDVIIDESLNYLDNIVLFPKKLKKINAILAKGGLPKECNLGDEPIFFEIPSKVKPKAKKAFSEKIIANKPYVQAEKHNDYNPIGNVIQQTRLKRQLTQEALAELVGVDKTLIYKIENNDNSVTMGTILQVFHVLNAELSFVVKLQK
jgi:HTH-type transcriptional regulator / antitoxin HipB